MTLSQYVRLGDSDKQIKRQNINILLGYETKWENNGNFTSDRHRIIYADQREMKEELD